MQWTVTLERAMTAEKAEVATGAQLLEAIVAIKNNEDRRKAWWQVVIYGPWKK